jgi:hypothetical protein
MNTIRIGQAEKALSQATESWITHQVLEREKDGVPVCVQVILKDDGVDMILATPQCGGGGGGGRLPNAREQELFKLWEERHLNRREWAVGNLIAFLKQSRLLR